LIPLLFLNVIMDTNKIDQLRLVLAEVKRLRALPSTALEKLIKACHLSTNNIVKQYVTAPEVYGLLKDYNTPGNLLNDDDQSVSTQLFRLLLIHFSLTEKEATYGTIAELRNEVQQNIHLKPYFNSRDDLALFIIYLEHVQKSSWVQFATHAEGLQSEIPVLNDSIPFCKVDLDTLLSLISKIKEQYTDRASYRLLMANTLLNMKGDESLRKVVLTSIGTFFTKPEWLEVFPYFLRGAINDELELFQEQFQTIVTSQKNYPLAECLYALAVSCPEDEAALDFCYNNIKTKLDEKAITNADYLKTIIARNRINSETIGYLSMLSTTSRDKQELVFLSDILINNQELHYQEEWHRRIIQNIVPAPYPELVANFNHLLTTYVDKDPKFVYRLLKLHFIVNGSNNFLDDPWHTLPGADLTLFEKGLLDWFFTGNRHIHLALHHLTNNAPIDSHKFKLSQDGLSLLSSTDKYYIACKITGYVYDKFVLRELLFSLTAAVKQSEKRLLDELYIMFTDYVIHNYRSTLDEIKKIVSANMLPVHLIEFYQRIIDYFEAYFNGLDQVPLLIELRGDPVLSQHIRFYTSQQVTEQIKKSHDDGLGRFFTNVTVNSNRWAIRRPGEKTHTPQTLGLVRSEMEFPAGEILNPVSSERFRKSFQQLERHEINID